jgi:arsenite methyltransferase
MEEQNNVRSVVKEKYGLAALRVIQPAAASDEECCKPALAGTDPIVRDLYSKEQTAQLPEEAVRASLGCGNPTLLAELKPGEVVLDLGSGGGIDVLLSAQRVGSSGKAYGLDMTDEMLNLARENQKKAGATNAEFLKGTIEEIPLPDASVDVIISNCVINLSADKDKVLREAFRVLKPGGRFAVSDIVLKGALPPMVKASLDLWAGCVSGALSEDEYQAKLNAAGFRSVSLTVTRTYSKDDAKELAGACCGVEVSCCGPSTGGSVTDEMVAELSQVTDVMTSSFVKALKPS